MSKRTSKARRNPVKESLKSITDARDKFLSLAEKGYGDYDELTDKGWQRGFLVEATKKVGNRYLQIIITARPIPDFSYQTRKYKDYKIHGPVGYTVSFEHPEVKVRDKAGAFTYTRTVYTGFNLRDALQAYVNLFDHWFAPAAERWSRLFKKRENPSPATTLAAMRYRRQPEVLRRLRRVAPNDQTLDEAFEFLEGETGERQHRESALLVLSEYVRNKFDDASDALRWLTRRDHRLGVWCAAQVARTVVHLAPDGGQRRPLRALETVEDWVRGQATLTQVRIALNSAYTASSEAFDAYNVDSNDDYAAAAHAYYAAASVSDAAYHAALETNRSTAAATAAAGVATSVASVRAVSRRDRSLELKRLVIIVADAIMTFPELIRRNPSRRKRR